MLGLFTSHISVVSFQFLSLDFNRDTRRSRFIFFIGPKCRHVDTRAYFFRCILIGVLLGAFYGSKYVVECKDYFVWIKREK